MRLDSKQIFVEAFNGFFLKDKVDPSSSVQHSHFNLRLLRLFYCYWGLGLTHLCRDRNQAVYDDAKIAAKKQQEVSLLLLVKQQNHIKDT